MQVPHVNVYFESGAVSDESLVGGVYRVKHFYNKRFYKYTEEKFECQEDIESLLSQPVDKAGGEKTLFASEGCMLPSKSELNLARKGGLDLFTITNLSLVDIAHHLKIKLNLFAIVRKSLADREAQIDAFKNLELFTQGDVSIQAPQQQEEAKEP